MAEFGVYHKAFISINGVDLSDHCESVELPLGVEALDDTVHGDDTRSEAPGLFTWQITCTFNQDFAAAKVDATLHAALAGRTDCAIIFRPHTDAIAVTNPEWTGTGYVRDYMPFSSGAVGDHGKASCVIGPRSTLSRATA